MSHPLLRPLTCALLLASAIAVAGPKEEVRASIDKFVAARSYHITMQRSGAQTMTTEADFAAPDRIRMTMPMGTQYIIGDTMYMTVQGRSMKVPMGKNLMAQWRDPANIKKNEATMTFTALGSSQLEGKSARRYRIVDSKTPGTSTVLWIGSNDYPLRIDVSNQVKGKSYNTTMRYSRFNDPTIRVEVPK